MTQCIRLCELQDFNNFIHFSDFFSRQTVNTKPRLQIWDASFGYPTGGIAANFGLKFVNSEKLELKQASIVLWNLTEDIQDASVSHKNHRKYSGTCGAAGKFGSRTGYFLLTRRVIELVCWSAWCRIHVQLLKNPISIWLQTYVNSMFNRIISVI